MSRPVEFKRSSALAASAAEVWSRVVTMQGVNDELMPWVRMTFPQERASIAAVDVSLLGTVAFRSWLLAGGVVPFDRHSFSLLEIDDQGEHGGGFVEESTSWLQRRWRHERGVVSLGSTGCRVTDRLVVQPRLPFARPLVARMVPWLFDRRHRRLVRRFGPVS